MSEIRFVSVSWRSIHLVLIFLVSCWLPMTAARATSPLSLARNAESASASVDVDTAAESSKALPTRIEDLNRRIAATEAALLRSGVGSLSSERRRHLETQRHTMKYLLAVLTQLKTAHESIEELRADKKENENELKLLRSAGPSSPPPYSFLMLEGLRDQLAAEAVRHDSLEAEVATTRDLLNLVRQSSEQREKERRAARESLQRNRDSQATERLNANLDVAVLAASIAEETKHLRTMQLEEKEIELAINAIRCQYLEEQIRLIREKVVFSESDLERALAKLSDREEVLKQQVEVTSKVVQDVEQKWLEAKNRLDQAPGDPIGQAAFEAWQVARDSSQKEMAALNQRTAEVAILRSLWQSRFAIFHKKVTAAEMEEWREQVHSFKERLKQGRRLADLDFEQCRTDLALLEMQRNEIQQKQPELARWLDFRADQLKHLMGTHAKVFLDIESASVFLERFASELDEALGIEEEGRFLARAGAWATKTWNYEITSVADEPITVRKLVGTLIFLFVGWMVSRSVSRAIGRRLLPRFGLDGGNATAVQTIAFYLLFVLFGYFSLELIGVPLTVFAFLGGAVAIGVGFGSQNILNNFISGLILLFERPIRVGDLVNIDGTYGTIEHVGARSTRVKTGSNLEIIVPNSRFLENNVTNLTLSDERFRASVCVGVAYGSPTRKVSELLGRAVNEHPAVLPSPEPIILFKDFADNSLNFEVHFWIRMRTVMQGQKIESDVRHAIDELFDEAGITIAFPQRDVHLDATAPIEVRLQTGVDEPRSLKRAA